jgi:hypothetical protein
MTTWNFANKSSLKDVLERLPRTANQEVGQLTPLNWQKASQQQVRLAA